MRMVRVRGRVRLRVTDVIKVTVRRRVEFGERKGQGCIRLRDRFDSESTWAQVGVW